MSIPIHRRSEFTCPHCGAKVDGHSAIDDAPGDPHDGAVSICLYCSGLAIFTQFGLRVCTDEEWTEIMAEEHIQKALAAISLVRSQGGIPPCQT